MKYKKYKTLNDILLNQRPAGSALVRPSIDFKYTQSVNEPIKSVEPLKIVKPVVTNKVPTTNTTSVIRRENVESTELTEAEINALPLYIKVPIPLRKTRTINPAAAYKMVINPEAAKYFIIPDFYEQFNGLADNNENQVIKSNDYELPVDLQPHALENRKSGSYGSSSYGKGSDLSDNASNIQKIADNTNILASTQVLDRGLVGRSVTVGTTPTRIIQATFLRGYLILNPSLVVGGMASGTILANGTKTASGNTQANSIGVANYRDMHLFLNISAISGVGASIDIYGQVLDPVSGNWADSQLIFPAVATTGTVYANIGSLGLGTDFAIRWVLNGTGPSVTFSVGYVLKEGLPGTGAGVGKTIYLGNSGVTTVSGFPLLEGQSRAFYLKENTELWAVSGTSLDLRIFEL